MGFLLVFYFPTFSHPLYFLLFLLVLIFCFPTPTPPNTPTPPADWSAWSAWVWGGCTDGWIGGYGILVSMLVVVRWRVGKFEISGGGGV